LITILVALAPLVNIQSVYKNYVTIQLLTISEKIKEENVFC